MLRDFFNWWFGQLKDLLPGGLKSRMRQELCLLYLDIGAQQVDIHASFHNKPHRFGKVAIDADPEGLPELQRFLAELPRRPDRILVRVAQDRYLSREVELPLATEENLTETIGFQLDQLTPFTPEQVLYFCGVSERLPAQKKLKAWLAVTPTEQVDKALQLLGGPPPAPARMPRQAPQPDGPLQIMFRPYGQSDSRGFGGTLVLALVFALLLAGAFTLHVLNRIETRDLLAEELNQVRIQANEAAETRQTLQRLQQQSSQLAGLRSDEPRFIAFWDDLSERLDDQTWLQRLDLRDGTINLQGVADNAPRLIEQLEASPYLREVSFASSVTRDRASSKDRFNISARFVEPKAGGAS